MRSKMESIPELVEFVLRALTAAKQQVMVATHSPMILNYLDDDTCPARRYLPLQDEVWAYASNTLLFDSITCKKNLKIMGPGEAFADTNLVDLAHEIESITEAA